ncbi:MAG: hypothetical protein R3304_12800 [Longimicrobiales bacterium]|nr:hypothetical protein [Longimicrobiales bacterium]
MIGETLSLLGAMYAAIGPGLLLVASLPLLLVALLFVLRALRDQLKS